MKSPLCCAALAAMSLTSALAQSDTASIQKQIEANDAAVARAFRAKDFATLETLWSPHMVVNNPANHVVTRDDVFALIRHGDLNYSRLQTVMESFTVYGDIAIAMGHEDFTMAEGPATGKPLQRRYTDVWQHQGSHWVQIARQATILRADPSDVYGPPQ